MFGCVLFYISLLGRAPHRCAAFAPAHNHKPHQTRICDQRHDDDRAIASSHQLNLNELMRGVVYERTAHVGNCATIHSLRQRQ